MSGIAEVKGSEVVVGVVLSGGNVELARILGAFAEV